MAVTIWNPPTLGGMVVQQNLITTAKQPNSQPVRVLTRKAATTFASIPKQSTGGGSGPSVPTTGQIWPRGTTSRTS